MEMDLANAIGWMGTLLFLAGLGLYVRYRMKMEEEE